jgi:hypothetical protein
MGVYHVNSSTSFQLHFDPSGELLAAASACEADVFSRAYGNTRQELDEEYGPYEDASAFIALSDSGGEVVAACRLIVPSQAGLKSLRDTARPPWLVDGNRSARAAGLDLASTLDIATIGVRPGLRGAGLLAAIALYHAIVMATRANNLPYVVMIMDERARRLLTSIGCATQALPGTGPGPYLGSPASTPLWANVPNMMDRQRRTNPEGYRLVSQGVGLDGISVPALSAFVLRDRTPVISGSGGSVGVLERT